MTIKPWITNNGIKIKVGNKKANMALKVLDNRIKDCQKTLDTHTANRNWSAAGTMDTYINGMLTAFYVLYQEVRTK